MDFVVKLLANLALHLIVMLHLNLLSNLLLVPRLFHVLFFFLHHFFIFHGRLVLDAFEFLMEIALVVLVNNRQLLIQNSIILSQVPNLSLTHACAQIAPVQHFFAVGLGVTKFLGHDHFVFTVGSSNSEWFHGVSHLFVEEAEVVVDLVMPDCLKELLLSDLLTHLILPS
jgi:hypothetical protein